MSRGDTDIVHGEVEGVFPVNNNHQSETLPVTLSTNQRPVSRSGDDSRPIRGQYWLTWWRGPRLWTSRGTPGRRRNMLQEKQIIWVLKKWVFHQESHIFFSNFLLKTVSPPALSTFLNVISALSHAPSWPETVLLHWIVTGYGIITWPGGLSRNTEIRPGRSWHTGDTLLCCFKYIRVKKAFFVHRFKNVFKSSASSVLSLLSNIQFQSIKCPSSPALML